MTTLYFRINTVLIVVFCIVPALLSAEPQVWTLIDGTTFEGEFISVYATDAAFRDEHGKVIKIPLDRFSEESRTRIELEKAPKLTFDLMKKRDHTVFPSGLYAWTQRPPETRVHYGVRVKQTSTGSYHHELFLELFVIGRERLGNKYILLDHQNVTFYLNKQDRGRKFEFWSDRQVVLRNYNVGNSVRGETYYGYLVVVKDLRGEKIAVASSHHWLLDRLDNLRERSAGNYMNKSCERVFPTRPPVYEGG